MSNTHPTVLHQWFREVWNDGRVEAIHELLTDEAIAHGITDTAKDKGPEGFRRFYQQFRSDFSDIHVKVEQVIAQDDFEAAHCSVTEVHTGSGKAVQFGGMCLARIERGKIAEAWNYFDFLSMYQQIGHELVAPGN